MISVAVASANLPSTVRPWVSVQVRTSYSARAGPTSNKAVNASAAVLALMDFILSQAGLAWNAFQLIRFEVGGCSKVAGDF
jgi:hypothetical protein